MNNIIKRTWRQGSMVIIEDLRGLAFQAEENGHTFEISAIDRDGEPVELSGTPAGVMLRCDNQDVALTCAISSGKVTATLPANAYAAPGRFALTIFLTSGGQKMAIYACVGTVKKTNSGTVAPPAGDDVTDLISRINTAINAIPVNYNAAFAVAYENLTFPVKAGQFCINNGALKEAIVDIATSETYTAAHWKNANFGDELFSQKSALKNNVDNIKSLNAFNELYLYPLTATGDSITITSNDGHYHITASPGTGQWCNLFASSSEVPLKKGSPIRAIFKSESGKIHWSIYKYENGSPTRIDGIHDDGVTYFTIPNAAEGIILRISVDNNTAIDEDFSLVFCNMLSNDELKALIDDKETEIQTLGGLVDDQGTEIQRLGGLVGNPFEVVTKTLTRPSGSSGTNWDIKMPYDLKSGEVIYICINSYSGSYFDRLRIWGLNNNERIKEFPNGKIGTKIAVIASQDYDEIELMIVQSTAESPVTAQISYSVNATKMSADIEGNRFDIDELENEKYIINVNKEYSLTPTDLTWIEHAVINNQNGAVDVISDTTNSKYGYCASDFIQIDSDMGYICNNPAMAREYYNESTGTYVKGSIVPLSVLDYAFYTKDKAFVKTTSENSDVSKAIPADAKYIRVTITAKDMIPFARLIYGNYTERPYIRLVEYKKTPVKDYLKPNTGYEDFNMILFGDSITAGSGNNFNIAKYASDDLNANVVSVGFGASRMTYTLSGIGLFCFYHLCECIVSDDPNAWDDLDAFVESDDAPALYAEHLATLKATDWSKVNAIGILYGTNDYSSNTPVGESFNTTITNYDGACAYGIQLLLNKYPHLQVLVFTPFTTLTVEGNYNSGNDVVANDLGLYIQDYAKSLKNVQDGLHVPIANTNAELGINKYTIKYYSSDGTHPRTTPALIRLGHRWAEMIKRFVSPY